MQTQNLNEKFAPIRKGLLEFAVLSIIAERSVYAADILQALQKTEWVTQEGTLYPLLSKLRREELLEYEWKESIAGPPRKYYRLSKKGRDQLAETKKYFNNLVESINSLGH